MLNRINRKVISGSNSQDDTFDAQEQAIYFGGQGDDRFSNQVVGGKIAEGGSAWFVGGSGDDTYRAALDTVTVVQETGNSSDDQWFDVPGVIDSTVIAAEIDARHLLIGEQNGDGGVIFIDWRSPTNRIESFNVAIPRSGFRELSFSEFETLITNSQNFLGSAPIEAIPTLTQANIDSFRAEVEAAPELSRKFEKTGDFGSQPGENEPRNSQPVAKNDEGVVSEGRFVNLTILSNDEDPDNDQLSISNISQPARGEAEIVESDVVRYTPASGFSGKDSFTYTVADGNGGTDTADVTVTVEGSQTPAPQPQSPQASVFLTQGRGLSLADGAVVFGRSGGGEQVFLGSNVAGVELDANVERLDIASDFAALDFLVTSDGLTIANGGTTIASLPSLNQDLTLRFNDGDATVSQRAPQTFRIDGGVGGFARIDGDGADLGGVSLGGATAARPDAADTTPAANIFLNADASFTVAEPASVFGRSGGNESVVLTDGVTGVNLDANVERVDIPRALADLTFAVTDAGLEIQAGGNAVTSLPSLNQTAELRLAGGEATLEQTGAQTFVIAGGDSGTATVGPDTDGQIDVALGDASAQAISLAGTTTSTLDADLA